MHKQIKREVLIASSARILYFRRPYSRLRKFGRRDCLQKDELLSTDSPSREHICSPYLYTQHTIQPQKSGSGSSDIEPFLYNSAGGRCCASDLSGLPLSLTTGSRGYLRERNDRSLQSIPTRVMHNDYAVVGLARITLSVLLLSMVLDRFFYHVLPSVVVGAFHPALTTTFCGTTRRYRLGPVIDRMYRLWWQPLCFKTGRRDW
jgi:hypothetical protein